jgi:hypothetical protein
MIPETAFVKFLMDSPTINGAVNGRIRPVTASMADKMPFIVYNRGITRRPIHLLGDSGLVFLMIQVDIFAKSYADAKNVAEAVRNRVHGYIGPVTSGAESAQCNMAISAERDDYVPPNDASDTGTFRVSMDIDLSMPESFTTKT